MKLKAIILTAAFIGLVNSTLLNAQIDPANNIIGVDIGMPENPGFNYDSCFALGANLGMGSIGLYQNWTAIETAPNTFNLTIFDIADFYYPLYNMPVDLTIAPIHTNNLEVPSDLVSVEFNNTTFIHRFKTLLDSVKAHIPNLTLNSLVIGSEHDVYMGSDSILWAQYTEFYDSVSTYAKTLWPGLMIATELTFGGITTYNSYAQILNTNSDYIGVSYYPLYNDFTVKPPSSTIPADFATLVGLYPSKPICFYQYGYPSSAICNSSDALQAEFIVQTFTTWDTYASNVKMIDFTWLHDLDSSAVNYYGTYYGITDTKFLEFLRTLGLRYWDGNGTDKLSFIELQCQAKYRGYNTLNINCFTDINDQNGNNSDTVVIFPNPVQNQFSIQIPDDFVNAELQIFNSLGQLKKQISNMDDVVSSIDVHDLPNGIYFVVLKSNETQLSSKLIINK